VDGWWFVLTYFDTIRLNQQRENWGTEKKKGGVFSTISGHARVCEGGKKK